MSVKCMFGKYSSRKFNVIPVTLRRTETLHRGITFCLRYGQAVYNRNEFIRLLKQVQQCMLYIAGLYKEHMHSFAFTLLIKVAHGDHCVNAIVHILSLVMKHIHCQFTRP